jgi:hypothetical protein
MAIAAPLVCVASYLNVAQADLVRMQLAMEDIPARLDNTALVSWFWHYSNATGGVKVLVPEEYLDRARTITSPPPESPEPPSPHWACPRCHAEVDGRWHYCWSCGSTASGEKDPDFHDEGQLARAATAESCDSTGYVRSQHAAVTAVLLFLLVFVLSHGSPSAVLILFACFVFGALFRWLWDHAVSAAGTAAEQDVEKVSKPHDDTEPPLAENDAFAEVLVMRLWATSIFGMLWSPLFALWAIGLVLRLTTMGATLRLRDRFRYRCSLVFIVVGSLSFYWLAWATQSLLATILASAHMVAEPPL